MNEVRHHVLGMLLAAGYPAQDMAARADVPLGVIRRLPVVDARQGVHRRRWELRQCLDLLDIPPDPRACWITRGSRDRSGRARCSKKSLGTTILARQVYMLTSGHHDLGGLEVRHTCRDGGIRGCCAVHHLVVGSRSANMFDRGRHARGESIAARSDHELLHMDVLDTDADMLRELADIEAYMARLQPVGPGPCLAVDGSTAKHYRCLTVAGQRVKFHRYVLAQVQGRSLQRWALHECDRKQCVVCLYDSTPSRNVLDAFERGALGQAEDHPRATLPEGRAVRAWRLVDAQSWSTRQVADHLQVDLSVIQRLASGATYRAVTGLTDVRRRPYMSDRGVRCLRAMGAAGASSQRLAEIVDRGEPYVRDLLAHRCRTAAGGPVGTPPGRARGERVHQAKLDVLLAAVLRQRVCVHGQSCRSVAGDLGLSPSTVERLVREETWRSAGRHTE